MTDAPPAGWQPVPVPLPTYVTKPAVFSSRTVRTIDLTRPGRPAERPLLEEDSLLPVSEELELDAIIARRRAVGH